VSDRIDFSGQVAIVTSAGGGIGRAVALELARRGARVVGSARRSGATPDNQEVRASHGAGTYRHLSRHPGTTAQTARSSVPGVAS